MREAIHGLKYQNDLTLAYKLATLLTILVQSTDWKFDLVVPVPLSQKRLDQRGYNQAALLAKPLALSMEKPFTTRGLARVRETQSQVSLNIQQRKENVQDAFLADPVMIKGRSILLVDDVFTTGATMNAAAEALHAAGSRQVFALTVAKAVHRSQAIENTPANIV
ncbi:MAG: phosphoribosyltransferase family protein [Anaerolineaceae bacterium]